MQLDDKEDIPVADIILASTVQFMEIIASGKKEQIAQNYAGDPFLCDKLQNYLSFNHPKPLSKTIEADINKTQSG
jgi:hypothetical protein